jgi:uncharacterized RDD family membrane protein YckC
MSNHEGLSYAGVGRRSTAFVVDLLTVASAVLLVAIICRFLIAARVWTPANPGLSPEDKWRALGLIPKLFVVGGYLLSTGPLYLALFEASAWQATFGKRLLQIHVATDGGQRMSTAHSARRSVAKWFLNSFGLILVSFLMIAALERRKALHDFAANTVVLNGRPVPGGRLEPWRIVVGLGLPYVWLLATFLATL